MAQNLGVEQAAGIADKFDGNHLGRAGNAFAVVELEDEAVGLQRDHLAASSFLTSEMKSVASANRRIDAGEADVGDVVEFAQAVHDHLADEFAGDFALELFRHDGDDVIHEVVKRLQADRPLLAGFLDA